MNSPSKDLHPVKTCHVCKGMRVYYLFSVGGHRVVRCEDCGLVFLNPQPVMMNWPGFTGRIIFLARDQRTQELKQATTGSYLSEIRRYHGLETGRLLEIGCGEGDFLVSAEADGWHVTGIEFSPDACKMAQQRLKNGKVSCGELQQAGLASEQFDLCVFPM
jgi:2-polyprenyl-3-methyl-5-hydroxy-6-metoxy-1,4-benzoquinol methylase